MRMGKKANRWIGWKPSQPAAVEALRAEQRAPQSLHPPCPGWWLRGAGEARPGPDPLPAAPHLPKRCARQEEAVSEGSPRSEAATGMLSCKRSTAQGTA